MARFGFSHRCQGTTEQHGLKIMVFSSDLKIVYLSRVTEKQNSSPSLNQHIGL